MALNKVLLLGNLTRVPELRYTPQGTAVATFGLAVNRRFKSGEDLKEEVVFIDVVVWGARGEACGQYLHKGSKVLVEGRLTLRMWETDGQRRQKHEVVAEQVEFLTKPEGGQAS